MQCAEKFVANTTKTWKISQYITKSLYFFNDTIQYNTIYWYWKRYINTRWML